MRASSDIFIDSLAQVAVSARLGRGTKVWAFSRILDKVEVGVKCQFGQNVYVDRKVRIGNYVKVQNNVSIYTGVHISDGVFLGPSCVFTNVEFPRAFVERKTEFATTRVERGVMVGANATIVCGAALEEFSFIGAGSLVTKDVKPFSLVIGNPARPVGWVCACGERLINDVKGNSACHRCGFLYHIDDEKCQPCNPEDFEAWWKKQMMGGDEYNE